MKASKYNFIFPFDEEKQVIYNSRTGVLALLDNESYKTFITFCENGKVIEDGDLEKSLRDTSFIIENDIDELDLIQLHLFRMRYNSSTLSLTIAPTSDCNFRCIYCYEKDSIKPITMSMQTQDKLVNFVKRYVGTINNLKIVWYGGEPLMELAIIEQLTQQFLAICEENKITYEAMLVTNGYFLTSDVVKRLKSLKLVSIQVTLDGPQQDHDKRRFLLGGKPTFNRIISNLRENRYSFPCVISLRINVDKNNPNKTSELLDILRANDLTRTVKPYIAKIENYEGNYIQSLCYHSDEFSQIDFEFRKHLKRSDDFLLEKYPQVLGNFCIADQINSFVINADGKIYKCWNDIGASEKNIGDLYDINSININSYTYLNYIMYNPTLDKECIECKYLPICMGGCPRVRLLKHERCHYMKYRLNDYMKVIPNILLRNKKSTQYEHE